jgi:site-specific DNA recombinase
MRLASVPGLVSVLQPRGQTANAGGAGDGPAVLRLSAEQIEAAVIGQVRALLRQPEVVVGTWRAARAQAPHLTEAETREALEQLEPLWDALFPAEQARIVRLLVERVDVGPDGADVRLRTEGLASLMRDLSVRHSEAARMTA